MRMTSPLFAVLFSLVALSVPAVPPFEVVLIDGDFANGYHVTAGDIDSDSKPDIIALSERDAGYVAWYKNPTWEKFRITPETIRSPIDVLTADIDRDGDLDVVTVHDFLYSDETSLGGVSWLENTGRFQEPWPVHPIGYEPTLHRIRWIDLGGEGVSDILGAPIVGPGAKGPAYIGTTVRLEAYSAPADGSVHLWRERLIDDSLRLVHGLTVLDWDGDNRSDFMTASYEGITLFLNRPGGLERQRIGEGYRSEKGEQGSSEVERGHRAGNQPFVAAIEPRHGHQLVVYLPPKASERKESWQRLVIDDTFDTGHALACADLDGDGDDEIVAGYRGKGTSLFIYECVDPSGERWTRVPLDEGGMAANGCWVFDSDGDGDLDVVSTGGSTHNLKLYVNQTSH